MPHVQSNSVPPTALSLQCPSCSYTGRNKSDYDEHMEVHLRRKLHKCAECQQGFHSLGELNEHFQLYHMDLIQAHFSLISARKSPGGLKALSVDPASVQSLSQSPQLYKYLTTDPTKQPLACVVCGAYFQWQWTLAKHFEQDHASLPNPYRKRDGGNTPGQVMGDAKRQTLQQDGALEQVGQPRLKQCSHCTFTTTTSSELARHQLKHSIGWQLKCQLCPFTSKWSEHMQSHYSMYHPSEMYSLDDLWESVKPEMMPTTSSDIGADMTAQYSALAGEDTTIVIPEAPEDTEAQKLTEAPVLSSCCHTNALCVSIARAGHLRSPST